MAGILQLSQIAIPGALLGCGGWWLYDRRTEYMSDPVFQRGLLHLKKDQRVTDFCGDDIKPGWLITRDRRTSENWVKYEFTAKGGSGKLKTVLIGDYLTHLDLTELEQERLDYVASKSKPKKDVPA